MLKAAPVVGLLLVCLAVPAMAHGGHDPASYRWVDPPDDLPTAATAPASQSIEVPVELLDTGSADVWTADLQAVVRLESLSAELAPLRVDITPLDPAELPDLPDGEPNGNAYRITTPGTDLTLTGRLALSAPYEPTAVYHLDDSGAWAEVDHGLGVNGQVSADYPGPGVYVVAMQTADGGLWGWYTADPLRPLVVIVAIGAATAVVLVRRRRNVRSSGPTGADHQTE